MAEPARPVPQNPPRMAVQRQRVMNGVVNSMYRYARLMQIGRARRHEFRMMNPDQKAAELQRMRRIGVGLNSLRRMFVEVHQNRDLDDEIDFAADDRARVAENERRNWNVVIPPEPEDEQPEQPEAQPEAQPEEAQNLPVEENVQLKRPRDHENGNEEEEPEAGQRAEEA